MASGVVAPPHNYLGNWPIRLQARYAARVIQEEWLEQLLPYLDSNFAMLQEMLAERLPSAHFDIP